MLAEVFLTNSNAEKLHKQVQNFEYDYYHSFRGLSALFGSIALAALFPTIFQGTTCATNLILSWMNYVKTLPSEYEIWARNDHSIK